MVAIVKKDALLLQRAVRASHTHSYTQNAGVQHHTTKTQERARARPTLRGNRFGTKKEIINIITIIIIIVKASR